MEVYQTADGKQPFANWLRGLKDEQARSRIRVRIARLQLGNLGDCKSVGGGLLELRIDHGPGYRVYFARRGDTLVLLLCGGDKRAQARDIKQARAYLTDYEQRVKP
ncbi:MAG: type II toxin-antitoxin system RelE/ParE family toxin [Gammaproteobacteria bacterium]|nr:type II toxin-antitoxin system RelE/ParE family toxin [Gammaproteobacteria bacterium]